ncbi:hypothetical protein [Rhizobium esperanzae]|nr:hypothetical protein [Rhizobium esperanzae]
MLFGNGRSGLAILMVGVLVSCQSTDKPQQPRFTSVSKNAPTTTTNKVVGNQYFIEFRSRYALSYGHTYVVFGKLDQSGNMINPEVAGLAPASHSPADYVLGHFVPVPASTGWTDGDLEEQYRSASWRVLLSPVEYSNVVAYIRKLQATSKTWEATVNNCNAWTGQIARHMGYKTPGIWLRPQQYITQLREMNTG